MAKSHQIRIEIRGLSIQEIDYLKALARETKTKSFNEFLLAMCREKIEKGQDTPFEEQKGAIFGYRNKKNMISGYSNHCCKHFI